MPVHAAPTVPLTPYQRVLINRNFGLAWKLALPGGDRGRLSRDERVSAACWGLVQAARGFDPARGTRFSTYAYYCIRDALRLAHHALPVVHVPKYAATEARRGRADLAALVRAGTEAGGSGSGDATALGWLESPAADDADAERLLTAEGRAAIEDRLRPLDPRAARVLRLRLGLDDGRPRTLREVGAALHLTHERIRQIEVKALDVLRASG